MKLENMINVGDVVQMSQESRLIAIRVGGPGHPIFETAKVIGIIPGPKSIEESMASTNESTDILRVDVCGSPEDKRLWAKHESSPVFQVLAGAVEITDKGES